MIDNLQNYDIEQLINTIDENPDELHLDYTPSVHKLIELGFPAVEAVLTLLESKDEMTVMHAERVVEGVIIHECGENKIRDLFKKHSTDWEKIYEGILNTEFNWSWPVKGLQLGIRISKNNQLYWIVRNVSDKEIVAYSNVITYEKHYDWITVNLKNETNEIKKIVFIDDRDRSAPVYKKMRSRERFLHRVDILEWTKRPVNRNSVVKNGNYKLQVIYHNKQCKNCNEFYKSIWYGTLESPYIDYNFIEAENIEHNIISKAEAVKLAE